MLTDLETPLQLDADIELFRFYIDRDRFGRCVHLPLKLKALSGTYCTLRDLTGQISWGALAAFHFVGGGGGGGFSSLLFVMYGPQKQGFRGYHILKGGVAFCTWNCHLDPSYISGWESQPG